MTSVTISSVVAITLLSGVAYLMNTTYQHRSRINKLRKQGMPMPSEWSWITGHLLTLQKYVDKLPPDANVNLAMRDLAMEYGDTEVFLMDFWPLYPALLMVYSPDVAQQITTQYNLPKTSQHLTFMKPIAGGPNLVSMSGEEWKKWRNLFNPGFSATSMMDNMPHVIDKIEVFCEQLKQKVGKGMFCLDDLTTRLTMDVIIKVTLDADLDYQRVDNPLAAALGHITRWHSFWNPVILMNPLRPIVQKYYGNVMDNYIRAELDKRFQELKKPTHTSTGHAKSVIALALEAYIDANRSKNIAAMSQLDYHFAKYATYQIRLFLFAGNDTTSSSIVYVYHLLSKHPEVLKKVREEHDTIFGVNPSEASSALRRTPTLLNNCRYSLAVIKETLRLYPPAATMRAGKPGIVVTDRHNNSYAMDYIGATVLHPAVHSNPRVWVRSNEFLPERFLVDPGHELYPDPSAYRPFEHGPRACIGQTLVYNEMRTVLVMTARTFVVTPAYDEWDKLQAENRWWGARLSRKLRVVNETRKTVHGDRAYQTEKAGTHPADGYPCHVSLA